jgi:hypothetical protein
MSTLVVSASHVPASSPRRAHEQRRVAERLVDRAAGLAPDVLLAEEVAVVGADDHRGVVTPSRPLERIEQRAEPRVDHRELPPYCALICRPSRGEITPFSTPPTV